MFIITYERSIYHHCGAISLTPPARPTFWNPAGIIYKKLLHIKRHEGQNKHLNKTTNKRLANDCHKQAGGLALA